MTMPAVFVLTVSGAAFFLDLMTGKISNVLIFAGFGFGFVLKLSRVVPFALSSGEWSLTIAAIGIYLAGAALPMVLGWLLFRFRMLGAGDIKLLMVIGGVLGPVLCLKFLFVSVICGAAISLPLMIGVTGVRARLEHLRNYFRKLCLTGKITSYREDKAAEYHYTAAIFMSAVLYAGGLIR